MATYVVPQVKIFQRPSQQVSVDVPDLTTVLVGPNAKLFRYSVDSEKSLCALGFYDNISTQTYPVPNRPVGSIIDSAYAKLFIEKPLLRYFVDDSASGDSILPSLPNRLVASATNFASSSFGARAAALGDRDVKAGDIVRAVVGTSSGSQVVWTKVKAVRGVTVPPAILDSSSDPNNASTQSASTTVTKIAGPPNCILTQADGTNYNGLPTGHISETYDILVTQSSTGGDLTTARLRIISASGTDDQDNVTPAAVSTYFNIGTRGLQIRFTIDTDPDCVTNASSAGVPANDLVVGQRWRVVVNQAFTAPTATFGNISAFTGLNDTTYIVTVYRGGRYTDPVKPQIVVTTVDGSDVSGPTTVPAAATNVPVGTYNLMVQFSGTALRKGDKYYCQVRAKQEGARRILELTDNLPSNTNTSTEVSLELFIVEPFIRVSRERFYDPPNLNWELSGNDVLVHPDIMFLTSQFTIGGSPQYLPVFSNALLGFGRMYFEYRAWLPDAASEVRFIRDLDSIESIPGQSDPDNPLKWAAIKAMQNSSAAVAYVAVADPSSLDSWAAALELLIGRYDLWAVVPLSDNELVWDLVVAHVQSQSSPESNAWRTAWIGLPDIPEIPIIAAGSNVPGHRSPKTSDGNHAMGTFTDDPDTAGSQFTILTLTSGNANFLEAGVRPGDVVRSLYVNDGFGNLSYSTFVVDSLISAQQLRLRSGPGASVTVPVRFEIWRNLSILEQADELAKLAEKWNSRRVIAVWGMVTDDLDRGHRSRLASAVAAMASSSFFHVGLTRAQVNGFIADTSKSKFNKEALNRMAGGGIFLVVYDPVSFDVYVRHAVTTGNTEDVNQREEVVTRAVDSISHQIRALVDQYVGTHNVTDAVLTAISILIRNLFNRLSSYGPSDNQLGNTLQFLSVERHEQFADHVVVRVKLSLPYPINVIEVYIDF